MLNIFTLLGIADWRDGIEIVVLTLSIYGISSWLKRDRTRPLLALFYGYCCITLLSHAPSLTVLCSILTLSAPILAVLAIIGHQDALQRRLVMFRVKNSMKAHTSDWLETVIRFGLIAINQGKEWFIVIENQHELNTIIKTSHQLHASINEELFSIITTSSRYQPGSLVWIKSSGIIQGINAHWALAQGQEWHTADVKDLPLWKQDALLMTVQTDAIVFKALPDWRTFDVIIGGKIFEQVSASQALALMKKHLHYQTLIDQEGITYEPTPSSSLEQRTR